MDDSALGDSPCWRFAPLEVGFLASLCGLTSKVCARLDAVPSKSIAAETTTRSDKGLLPLNTGTIGISDALASLRCYSDGKRMLRASYWTALPAATWSSRQTPKGGLESNTVAKSNWSKRDCCES